jgi:hypothetical protein
LVEFDVWKSPSPLLVKQDHDIAAKTGKQHSNLKAERLVAKTCHFSGRLSEGPEARHWNHGVFGFLFKFLDSIEAFSWSG